MKYEPTERFRTGGLRETPGWRLVLYVILFAIAVSFLGTFNHFLFYAIPIAALFVVLLFVGMHRALNLPHLRAWVIVNLLWIIPLFIFLQSMVAVLQINDNEGVKVCVKPEVLYTNLVTAIWYPRSLEKLPEEARRIAREAYQAGWKIGLREGLSAVGSLYSPRDGITEKDVAIWQNYHSQGVFVGAATVGGKNKDWIVEQMKAIYPEQESPQYK